LALFYLQVTYKAPVLGPVLHTAIITKPLFSPILYVDQNTKWPFLPLLSYTCIFLGVFLPFLYDGKLGPGGKNDE